MRTAFGNYTYALYTLDYFFDSMQRLGIDTIELWGAAPHFHLEDRGPKDAEMLGATLRSRGLAIACFTPEQCAYPINIASEDATMRRRSIAFFEKAIDYAPLLGAPAVLVTPGQGSRNLPRQEAQKRSLDAMDRLARRAEAAGLVLYFEHLTRSTTNLVVTMAEMAAYLGELCAPNVLPMADLDMMAREGEGLADFERALGRMPAHVHVVDGMPGGHMVPGDGVLPLADEMAWLQRAGYAGTLTFEVMHESTLTDPDTAVRRCLEWLNTLGTAHGMEAAHR